MHTPVWESRSTSRYAPRGGSSGSSSTRLSWATELQSVKASANSGPEVSMQAWGPRRTGSSSTDVDRTSKKSRLRHNPPAIQGALPDFCTKASTATIEPPRWGTFYSRSDTSQGGQQRINNNLLNQHQTDSPASHIRLRRPALNLPANSSCPNSQPLISAPRIASNEGNGHGNSGGQKEALTGPQSTRLWKIQRTKEAERWAASTLRHHRAASAPTRRTYGGKTAASISKGERDASATSAPTCKERDANKGRRMLKPTFCTLNIAATETVKRKARRVLQVTDGRTSGTAAKTQLMNGAHP